MADFTIAVGYLLKDEGGYWDDPGAGPTAYGITLKQYRIEGNPNATADDLKALTRPDAVAWYAAHRWKPNFTLIHDQALANKLFSTYVNMDSDSIQFVQRALRSLFGLPIKDDGVFGSKTLAAVNSVDPVKLLREFRAQQARHYAVWYAKAPEDRDGLLLGLMRRAVET